MGKGEQGTGVRACVAFACVCLCSQRMLERMEPIEVKHGKFCLTDGRK